MKRLVIAALCVTMTALAVPTAQAVTIDWKGVTWDVKNGTAAVNGDGSLTLTLADNSGDKAWLHANRLSPLFDKVRTPWIRWAFEGHKADILIEQETAPGPTIQAGATWGNPMAVTRYSDPNRQGQYFIWVATPSNPIDHDLHIAKQADGTVEAQFDAQPLATTDFLKTNVGGDWGFNDVYLRLRGGVAGDTVTFNDFQFGGAAVVPEPTSLVIWSVIGLGFVCIGRRRRRQAAT